MQVDGRAELLLRFGNSMIREWFVSLAAGSGEGRRVRARK